MSVPPYFNAQVHASQFPDRVWSDLCRSLRTRQIQHKFHYETYKQSRKWLALHETYSPARTDPECQATYDRAMTSLGQRWPEQRVHLTGLGCGGGHKDVRLLQILSLQGKPTVYTPVDVSLPLVARAWHSASQELARRADPPGLSQVCSPIICDLAAAEDPAAQLREDLLMDWPRLVTFFGMMPNFEPQQVLPRLAGWTGQGGHLLLSANLAPGSDYEAGIKSVLALYHNPLTEDWLQTLLWDLGFEPTDGQMQWDIEEWPAGSGLRRITAHYHLQTSRSIHLQDEAFAFQAGDRIRLFFSYRHTPENIQSLLATHQFALVDQWISARGEEGIFLFQHLG